MRNEASGRRKSGSMVKDKKLDTKTERTSGEKWECGKDWIWPCSKEKE